MNEEIEQMAKDRRTTAYRNAGRLEQMTPWENFSLSERYDMVMFWCDGE